ncbi:MAG: hypothetical protein KDB90_12510 [Planctomycetes bacterium]|nr:hypothetical protein [Planctomycetota bacterium]
MTGAICLLFAWFLISKFEKKQATIGAFVDMHQFSEWDAAHDDQIKTIFKDLQEGKQPETPADWRRDWPGMAKPVLDANGNAYIVFDQNRYGSWGLVLAAGNERPPGDPDHPQMDWMNGYYPGRRCYYMASNPDASILPFQAPVGPGEALFEPETWK